MLIIGLAGRARTGKDTIADRLCDQHNFKRYAFADPVRAGVKAAFNLTDDSFQGIAKEITIPWIGRSPRELMQTFGTEYARRMIKPTIWLDVASRFIEQHQPERLVITDIRFQNELDWVREHGGVIWHIRRPVAAEVAQHSSERDLPHLPHETIIHNDDTIIALQRAVDKLVREACATPA